ncbi:MAG: RluA family pseudouridine synthase [Lachnospiraceae bacterium]|nr:RluA family pseudouridine synthase [Lachnospiraceae bacterium]
MQEFVVTRKEAGGRFDKYLKKLLPSASSGFLYKMLRKKNITLNEKKAVGNEVIAAGDTVKLFFSEETYLKFSGKLQGQTVSGKLQEQMASEKMPESESANGYHAHAEQADTGRMKTAASRSVKAFRLYRKAFRELDGVSVIYEDEDILILNKPAGVLSQKAEKDDISLNEWMIGYLLKKKEITEEELVRFRPSVCNRLDRNTSGLLLCGKSVRGSQFLSEILRDRSLHKYYLTYVQGKIECPITLNGYLRKEEDRNRSEVISEEDYQKRISAKAGTEGHRYKSSAEVRPEKEYHKIETLMKPLSYYEKGDFTKLEILLVTGKSHQIRAHLSGIGHPILGDIKYGWKPKSKEEAKLKYQLLHAYRVEFPETKGEFGYLSGKAVTAPVPDLFGIFEESCS